MPLRASSTSIGVLRTMLSEMWIVASMPSWSGAPPQPTASLLLMAKNSPESGWVPTIMNPGTSPPDDAGRRSGIPCASAL